MRTDKITPAAVILHIVAAALLIALIAVGRSGASAPGRRSQLFAKPLAQDAAGADIWAIEDFIVDYSTLVTYEIKKQASAMAIRESYRMNLIGTNSAYADVMGYPTIDGGFFSKSAFLIGAREAVLNERAAATLFGGRRISGSGFTLNDESWTVVGIIMDDDIENSNIYVPASSGLILSGAASVSANALMTLLDGYSGADASMASNKLKDLGVGENSHSLKNLGKAAVSANEMASAALRFAMVLLLCLSAWRFGRYAFNVYKTSRAENEFYDLGSAGGAGASGARRADYIKAAINILLFCACAACALILARQIVEICITWQEIPLLLNEAPAAQDAFYGKLCALGEKQTITLSLFAASIAFTTSAQTAVIFMYNK